MAWKLWQGAHGIVSRVKEEVLNILVPCMPDTVLQRVVVLFLEANSRLCVTTL